MSKKSKKIIISLSVVVALIVIIVALSFTVFSLKKVEIDYRTSHKNITLSEEELVEGGDFSFGASVFFHGKNGYIEKIESLSPYIEVVNIETVFPSTFVVHIAERQEVYAFAYKNSTFITDQNLRILREEENFVSNRENAMLFEGGLIAENDYKVGDYLQIENFIDIYSSLFECNRTLTEQRALICSIKLLSEYDENIKQTQVTAILKLFGGQTVQIKNATYGLKYKLNMFLSVYSNLYSLIGQEIASGGVWTEELIDSCTIIVNNFYNYTEHNETECYFNILP